MHRKEKKGSPPQEVRMKKKKYEEWAWYPMKRLTEGKGLIGKVVKTIEDWEPLERIGNPEVRKITPIARVRKVIGGRSRMEIRGEREEEKVAKGEDVIEISFEELSDPVKNYAIKEAERIGLSLNEVIRSKAFKNYLKSRIK